MSKKSTQSTNDKNREFKLPEVFSTLTPNVHLIHLALLRQLNNQRAGTACTKTRSEVRGGGKKPWKQKGTGRARAGSIRSPLWVGGGIAFGPKPRSYESKIPQKARSLAIAQAIASRNDDIVLLKKLPDLKEGKTKELLSNLKSQGLTQFPILLVGNTGEAHYAEVKRASGNLPYVILKDEQYLGVFEVLKAKTIVITEKALSELEKRFSHLIKKKGIKIA